MNRPWFAGREPAKTSASDMKGIKTSFISMARISKPHSRFLVSVPISVVCVMCAFYGPASSAFADPVTTYRGICNASAGIDLGNDYFVVADDDINSLVVYRYGTPKPVEEVKLGTYLNGEPNEDDEADVEGAARIGERIYWITSHSSKDNGEPRPTRQRLFATRIDASGAAPTVVPIDAKPYAGLLDALALDSRFKELTQATAKGAEKQGGLNIEGLAATEDGGLLIGFRNPLSTRGGDPNKSDALALEIKNPADVVERGKKPEFGELIRLDLGNRGVRSIERIGTEYFIVAGPFDDGTADDPSKFIIFKWNRFSGTPPEHWKDVNPSTFHAEGIFEISGTKQLYLLSDDGDENKRICKKGPDKRQMTDDKTFRGMALDR
jgi:hypothetical protein